MQRARALYQGGATGDSKARALLNLLSIWREKDRTALWPVPFAMLLLALLLLSLSLHADDVASNEALLRIWWLHSGSGDDARNLLTTLVAAIITMSSVVFSITVVALSLAANQFGSRLVRIYITDSRTKVALGLFIMTIVYNLLALRLIHKDMQPAQVPHITVTSGLLLGLICVLSLIFFVHRVARSMIADEVIRRVSMELDASVEALAPLAERPAEAAAGHGLPADFGARATIVRSAEDGYIRAINHEALATYAAQRKLVIKLGVKAGGYMCRDGWLGQLYPAEAVTDEDRRTVQQSFHIGTNRTPTQDLEFSLRHLVDIALRALSPGINDSNTALVVIDHLRSSLSRLMGKALPTAQFRDDAGTVRVTGPANGYGDILDAALHQIRQAAAPQPAVIIGLLGALSRMAEHVRLPEQADALSRHARLVAEAGLHATPEPSDRQDIEKALERFRSKLQWAVTLEPFEERPAR